MLTALALRSQLFSAFLFAVRFAVVHKAMKSWFPPVAFLRQSVVKNVKSAQVSNFWPFLLLQNPRVKPPPGPRQTLPKLTFCVSHSARVNSNDVAVVCTQFVSTGVSSYTV